MIACRLSFVLDFLKAVSKLELPMLESSKQSGLGTSFFCLVAYILSDCHAVKPEGSEMNLYSSFLSRLVALELSFNS